MPRKYTVTVYLFDELSDEAKETAREWYREASSCDFDADEFAENTLEEAAAYHHRVKAEHCRFSLNYCQGDGVAFYGDLDLDFFMAEPGEECAPEGGGSLAAERAVIQEKVRKLQAGGHTLDVTIAGLNGRNHHYNSMTVSVGARDGPDTGGKYARLRAFFLAAPWTGDGGAAMRAEVCETLFAAEGYVREDDEAPGPDETAMLVALDWLEERGVDVTSARAEFVTEDEYEALRAEVETLLNDYLSDVSHAVERMGYDELAYRDSDEVVDDSIRANEYEFTADGKRFVALKGVRGRRSRRKKRGKEEGRAAPADGGREEGVVQEEGRPA